MRNLYIVFRLMSYLCIAVVLISNRFDFVLRIIENHTRLHIVQLAAPASFSAFEKISIFEFS